MLTKVNGADLLLVKIFHYKKVSHIHLPTCSKSRVYCSFIHWALCSLTVQRWTLLQTSSTILNSKSLRSKFVSFYYNQKYYFNHFSLLPLLILIKTGNSRLPGLNFSRFCSSSPRCHSRAHEPLGSSRQDPRARGSPEPATGASSPEALVS